MTELLRIEENELKKAYKMHRQGFMPTFFKYFDRKNPIFMRFTKFCKGCNHPDMYMFWIVHNGEYVGEIWIQCKGDTTRLARVFVLKAYQNRGIAQQAIKLAEGIFFESKRWWLDTIKEEKNNCHLYEKLGYKQIGREKRINRRMTIIEYEKRLN